MSDLIDRDALIEVLEDHVTTVSVCATVAEARARTEMKRICIEDVRNAPAVDAAPVVHGRLLRTDAYPHRLYCSNCYHTIVPNEEMVPLYNMTISYCLHCGAKMDGGDA